MQLCNYLLAFSLLITASGVQADDFWQKYPMPVAGGVAFISINNENKKNVPVIHYKNQPLWTASP